MESKQKRKVVTTKDGSPTLFWPEYDEYFHSIHGAITESSHVFIDAGLNELANHHNQIKIFEMGFGTGLNAILSYLYAKDKSISISYTSIDAYPLSLEELSSLQLENILPIDLEIQDAFHKSNWNEVHQVSNFFELTKQSVSLQDFSLNSTFDLIYYDAFAPSAQPELWTKDVFEKLYEMLNKKGLLTTYCAKGQVKRDLKSVGFTVVSLPGPPGKREMTKAIKE